MLFKVLLLSVILLPLSNIILTKASYIVVVVFCFFLIAQDVFSIPKKILLQFYYF